MTNNQTHESRSMKTFVVKGELTFTDGINRGSLKVKAENEEQAQQFATDKLREIWKSCVSIKILSVKKR